MTRSQRRAHALIWTVLAVAIASVIYVSVQVRPDPEETVNAFEGEAEQRVNRIFEQDVRSDATLEIEEADAVLGNRTDVQDSHDRFANLETNYLLQRMQQAGADRYAWQALVADVEGADREDVSPDFVVTLMHEHGIPNEEIEKFSAAFPHDASTDKSSLDDPEGDAP